MPPFTFRHDAPCKTPRTCYSTLVAAILHHQTTSWPRVRPPGAPCSSYWPNRAIISTASLSAKKAEPQLVRIPFSNQYFSKHAARFAVRHQQSTTSRTASGSQSTTSSPPWRVHGSSMQAHTSRKTSAGSRHRPPYVTVVRRGFFHPAGGSRDHRADANAKTGRVGAAGIRGVGGCVPDYLLGWMAVDAAVGGGAQEKWEEVCEC